MGLESIDPKSVVNARPSFNWTNMGNIIYDNNKVATGVKACAPTWFDVYGHCPYCDKDVEFIDMDKGMVDIIQYMNQYLHYETLFCCEGHGPHDDAYLIFQCNWDDVTYSKILEYVPKDWEIFRTSLSRPQIDMRSTKCEIAIHSKMIVDEEDNIKYINNIESLREFIMMLPVNKFYMRRQ
jgi:hypothetical protein